MWKVNLDMASSGGTMRIQCPSCGNTVSISGVKGVSTQSCPHCRTNIRITMPDQVTRPGFQPKLDEDEAYRYEGDITLRDQVHLIRSIVIKDVMSLKNIYIVLVIVCLFLTALIAAQASSRGSDGSDLTAEELKNDKIDGIWNSYLISLFLLGPILMLITNQIYGFEVKRGTMRLLTLYPINMNGLSIAKILSTAVILGIFHFLILVIPTYPLNLQGVYPWITSVMIMSYLMNLFIIITGTFATHIITYLTGKLMFTMNRLIALMIIIYGMLTETFFTWLAVFVMTLRNASSTETDRILHEYVRTGQALGLFSPYHAGGRMITAVQGVPTGSSDVGLVILIGMALIIGGYLLGKKTYLDVFIRE